MLRGNANPWVCGTIWWPHQRFCAQLVFFFIFHYFFYICQLIWRRPVCFFLCSLVLVWSGTVVVFVDGFTERHVLSGMLIPFFCGLNPWPSPKGQPSRNSTVTHEDASGNFLEYRAITVPGVLCLSRHHPQTIPAVLSFFGRCSARLVGFACENGKSSFRPMYL